MVFTFKFALCIMWLVFSLAETNSTPFVFAEWESELVSGFNVLAGYSNIFFTSMFCSMLFLLANFASLSAYMKLGFMVFLWVWIRGTLPRYRYDKLMMWAWKIYLPVSLNYLLMSLSLAVSAYVFIL